MARHYLPLRDGYHFEVGQGVSELSFEGHQSGINAISLVRRAPMPVRAEFGRKSVEAEPPFLFLSFQGEGGRLFGPGGFEHETLYFSVFDFFTEYNRISLEGLKILHPGRYAHERLLFLDDYFRLSLSKIVEAIFILLKEDNPSFLLSEQRLLYEFIRLYQKEMAYIGLRVPRGYAKGILDPAFELLGRSEGKPSLEELSRACSLSKTTFIRKFKAAYGSSPSSYLEKERLEAARHFLLVTPDSISEIAFRLGYGSPSAFDRAFKKHFGESPREAREKAKGGQGPSSD